MRLGRRAQAAATALVALVAAAACARSEGAARPDAWVEIDRVRVAVELARTPEEQRRGLSGRDGLGWGEGMLFLYRDAGFQQFWMIDMRFPIDMVWIRDGRIVGIHHRVPPPADGTPPDALPRYAPGELVDAVLEVPAGFAQASGWARDSAVRYGGGALAR